MTFLELAQEADIFVRRYKKRDEPINLVAIAQKIENDFIRRTYCTQAIDEIDTSTENGGTLTYTYSLASDFVTEFRVTWKGKRIFPLSQLSNVSLYDNDADRLTGSMVKSYFIEGVSNIVLVPQPSQHGICNITYCKYNTNSVVDPSIAEPIIPVTEHEKLVNGIVARALYILGQDQLADRKEEKYVKSIIATKAKYKLRRYEQERIEDVLGVGGETVLDHLDSIDGEWVT